MKTTSDIPRRYPIRLWLVVAAYVLFWPLATVAAWAFPAVFQETIVRVLLLAAAFGCVSLLAIWVGLSNTAIWNRILGAAWGVICLVSACVVLVTDPPRRLGVNPYISRTPLLWRLDVMEWAMAFSLQLLGIAGALLILRGLGTKLCLLDNDDQTQWQRAFQFSLRSLMGLTLAVSLMFSAISSYWVYHREIVFGMVVAIVETVLILATVWAGLGRGRSLLRIVPVVFVAIGLGQIAALTGRVEYFLWSIFTVLEVLLVVGPLLVVRSMGYRLVPKDD
jgi:hypothetical protein